MNIECKKTPRKMSLSTETHGPSNLGFLSCIFISCFNTIFKFFLFISLGRCRTGTRPHPRKAHWGDAAHRGNAAHQGDASHWAMPHRGMPHTEAIPHTEVMLHTGLCPTPGDAPHRAIPHTRQCPTLAGQCRTPGRCRTGAMG